MTGLFKVSDDRLRSKIFQVVNEMIQVTEIKGSRSDWRSVALNFAFTLRLVTANKISFDPRPKWPTFPAAAEKSRSPTFTAELERREGDG